MNLRESSKREFGVEEGNGTYRDIEVGSLQRIADACELMAKSYAQLIKDRDMYERWYRDERKKTDHLRAVNNGIRGYVAKLKREKK